MNPNLKRKSILPKNKTFIVLLALIMLLTFFLKVESIADHVWTLIHGNKNPVPKPNPIATWAGIVFYTSLGIFLINTGVALMPFSPWVGLPFLILGGGLVLTEMYRVYFALRPAPKPNPVNLGTKK